MREEIGFGGGRGVAAVLGGDGSDLQTPQRVGLITLDAADVDPWVYEKSRSVPAEKVLFEWYGYKNASR